jgi:predicted transcriptional regulator
VRYPLEEPPTRLALIRELATGAGTQTELAAKYGVSQPSVSEFAQRHARAIDEVRRNADDEYAGIAYALKRNRIAEYADQIGYCRSLLDDPVKQVRVNVGTAEILRTAQSALHAISEELGQLPARGLKHEGDVSVRYVIEGVDPEAYS